MLMLGIALIHLTMAVAPGRATARAESTVAVLRGASEFYLGAGSTIEVVAQGAFAVDARLTVAAVPSNLGPRP